MSLVQDGGAANTASRAEVGKNGVLLFGQDMWVPPVATRSVNYIGRSYWGIDGMFQGDIAEIILYNRKLSVPEQATVRSYIAGKYGLVIQ